MPRVGPARAAREQHRSHSIFQYFLFLFQYWGVLFVPLFAILPLLAYAAEKLGGWSHRVSAILLQIFLFWIGLLTIAFLCVALTLGFALPQGA